jgi:hypothetical protein
MESNEFDNEGKKALDVLFDNVKNYRNSSDYLEMLSFITKFPGLSPFNAFLIKMQNNGVAIVKNAKQWGKLKRTIKPAARPLVILVPFGPVDFVYDIADTDGKPIPEQLINPFKTKGNINHALLDTIYTNLNRHGFILEEYVGHKSLAGFVKAENNSFKIMLNKTWDDNVKLSTLFHELGHLFAGHVGITSESWWKARMNLSKEQREFEAESISYLVCKRIGLESNSDEYLSGYTRNNKEIPNISFETVLTVAGYIESMTKKGFKLKKLK